MNRMNAETGRRLVFGVLGWLSVGLGTAGVFLPGLPTTVFVIAAAYCFARSSPRFEAWLMTNRILGPRLRRYRENGGAMPRSAKVAALTSMWGAIAISSAVLVRIHIAAAIGAAGLGVIGTVTILCWVRTLPEPARATPLRGGSPVNRGIAA